MDKKKVGELDGTPIVTGKKNYANEHEYYLTMNEDNTYRKLEQRVSGDKFRLVLGGGGNDYPTPTAGDVNKVWLVTPVQKGTKTEETVIVPEQTLISSQVLEYNDKFVPGAQCVAVIEGVEYRGEVVIGMPIEAGDIFKFEAGLCGFQYNTYTEEFIFYNNTDVNLVTASLSVIGETPIYDYNWAPGVKIPIPTAEDEGKILVVTKVEGDNTSTIVPEQEVPADKQTPLTDVDLKYFIPGNTVTATVTIQQTPDEEEKKGGDVLLKESESSNSQTLVVSGIIIQEDENVTSVVFNEGQEDEFSIIKILYGEPEITPPIVDGSKLLNTKSSTDTEYVLITNLYEIIDGGSEPARSNTIPYATIKLEYSESNYEYQLQENSGSGSDNGFKYNELPEPAQFRDPEGEEGNPEIFVVNDGTVLKVLDLKDGIVPKEIIMENSKGGYDIYQLTSYKFDINRNSVIYCMCTSDSYAIDIAAELNGDGAFVSKDGTLLGIISLGKE